jgi:hypothetical protein
MTSVGTAYAIGNLLAQMDSDVQRSLEHSFARSIIPLILFIGAILAFWGIRSSRKNQGFESLRPPSKSDTPVATGVLVVSHRSAAASGKRLASSLRKQGNWTVKTPSSSLREVASAQAMVVVVDGSWPVASNGRLAEPGRRHLNAARAAGVPIWPVLVDGATMPQEPELPAELSFFSEIQAHTVFDDSWDEDVADLTEWLARA